jgi:hypothetical protein
MTAAAPTAHPIVTPTTASASHFDSDPPMTEGEVDEAIRLHSPLLVAEVYETVRRNVENFGQKLARLDQKATTLIGGVALSLTVALFALLHKHDSAVSKKAVLVCFLIAATFGVLTGIAAAIALFVRDHAELSDRAIFNVKELRDADATDPNEQQKGLASYRRGITLHLWKIAKQREEKIRKKARAIKAAQVLFFAFLAALIVVGVAASL